MAEYTEIEEQGWFSRIKQSLKGVVVGGGLFVLAFPVLFLNEGRAVDRARDLELGAGQVVEVAADQVDPAREGKLIHFSGMVGTDAPLVDSDLGVTAPAVKLSRKVEMYQWVEKVKETTEKKVGGKTETKKEYDYAREWRTDAVDSERFKITKGHWNPGGLPFESRDLVAQKVTVGAFELTSPFINNLSRTEPLSLEGESAPKRSAAWPDAVVRDGTLYLNGDPGSPEVGDVRVSYDVVLPAEVTVVGAQKGATLAPFQSPEMTSAVNELRYGKLTAAQVFQAAQDDNVAVTWFIRILGFFMLAIGLSMFFKPLSVLGDVVPIFGSIIEAGTKLVAFVVSVPLALATIAFAWLFYRPLVGVPMLLLGIAGVVGALMMAKKRAAARAALPSSATSAAAAPLKKAA